MTVLELKDGRLGAAALGRPANDAECSAVLAAIRKQLVEVLRRPLLPVTWDEVEGGHSLTALDQSGQVITVELLDRLDGSDLLAAMGRQSEAAGLGRGQIATQYPGGGEAFKADWNEFREELPARVEAGPPLIVLTTAPVSAVLAASSLLAYSGIEVHIVAVRAIDQAGGQPRLLVTIDQLRTDLLSESVPQLPSRASRGPGSRTGRSRGHAAPASPGAGPERDVVDSHAMTRPGGVPVEQPTPVTGVPGGRPAGAGQRVPPAGGAPATPPPAPGSRASRRRAPATDPVAAVPPPSPSAATPPTPAPTSGRHETRGASAPPSHAPGGHAAARRAPAVPGRRVAAGVSYAPGSTTQTVRLTPASEGSTPPSAATPGGTLGHRSGAPVLGAGPSVPTGQASAKALAAVAGAWKTPATLVWKSLRRGIDQTAELRSNGAIVLPDGRAFTDPSQAADELQHVMGTDGWRVWRLGAGGPTLLEALRTLESD